MTSKVAQPTAAAGQIWDMRPACGGAEDVVHSVREEDGAICFEDGGYAYPEAMADCRCIGISTPAGRVMVGERRRRSLGTEGEVVGIDFGMTILGDTHRAIFQFPDGVRACYAAEIVARWPLVSPPILQGAEVPERKPERRDTDICKCGASKTASMVMCPGCAADAVMSGRWEKAPDLRARYYAAAHEEHPRPGTLAWLVKSVAYLCSIPKDDVAITEDHARALVIVRVPRSVTADTMRAAATWLKDAVPLTVCIRLEYATDPREQGPGIAAWVPVRPSVRPDVVATEVWERWSLP